LRANASGVRHAAGRTRTLERRGGAAAERSSHHGAELQHIHPHSHTVIAKNFAGVPADETYQMVAGNVITFFHLEPSPE
jgi:hypothetical protein